MPKKPLTKNGYYDTNIPRYVLKNLSYNTESVHTDLQSACNAGASAFAEMHSLPKQPEENKYHLQWSIVLRDGTYTRIYKSNCGTFLIIAMVI